jgi:hypothetical protein
MPPTSTFTRFVLRPCGAAVLAIATAASLGGGGGGCTTAAVATAGTVAGIAASAASTGADVYRMGKLDSADQARFDDWIAAARAAAVDLDLKVQKWSDNGKGVWRCTLADDRESTVSITVERRTNTLCRTRIDVGVFGSEPTARLILSRMRVHAEPTHAKAGNEPTTAPSTQRAEPLVQ